MAIAGSFQQQHYALFKPIFDAKVRDAQNRKVALSRLIKRDADPTNFDGGGKYIMTIQVGSNSAFQGRPELGNMPEGGLLDFIQTTLDMRQMFGTVQVSNLSQKRSESSKGAMASFIKKYSQDMGKTVAWYLEHVYLGAAIQETLAQGNYNGVSCLTSAANAVASTTVSVKGYRGWTKGDGSTFVARGNDGLRKGDKIVIGTSTTILNGTAPVRTVVSTSTDGLTLTVDVAVTCGSGDLVVRGDGANAADNEYNAVPNGLGFLQFTNESAPDKFQGQNIVSSGRDLLYKPNRKSMNSVAAGTLAAWDTDRINMLLLEHVNFHGLTDLERLTLVSNWRVHQEYRKSLVDQNRYADADYTKGTQPGMAGFTLAGKKLDWQTMEYVPRDKLMALTLDELVRPEWEAGHFYTWDSGSMWRDSVRQHAKTARWVETFNLGCATLGANLLIDDIKTA